jgi:hypothetical protein
MSLALELPQAAIQLPADPADTAVAATLRRRHDPAILYSLLVFILPLLAIPAFTALGRSNFFLHHGASVWVQSNDAIFDMRNRNCDVLVFGDSTAMTGIDPDVVDRATGFHTCNIAVTNAVLAVTGNLTLDRFLEHNAQPKILVVQLAPDDFQPENRLWHHTIYAEGLLEQLRHGAPADSRRLLLRHPHEAIAFAGYAAGYTAYFALKDIWFRTTHLRSEEDQVQVRNGFFTPPSPPRTYCEPAENLPLTPDPNFARNLSSSYRAHYSATGAVVLVDVAPIPSCDANLAAFASQLDGITSNTLQPLPIGLFNDPRHYTATGSRIVSTLIARQVNQTAQQDPALDDRTQPPTTLATLTTLRKVSLPR